MVAYETLLPTDSSLADGSDATGLPPITESLGVLLLPFSGSGIPTDITVLFRAYNSAGGSLGSNITNLELVAPGVNLAQAAASAIPVTVPDDGVVRDYSVALDFLVADTAIGQQLAVANTSQVILHGPCDARVTELSVRVGYRPFPTTYPPMRRKYPNPLIGPTRAWPRPRRGPAGGIT